MKVTCQWPTRRTWRQNVVYKGTLKQGIIKMRIKWFCTDNDFSFFYHFFQKVFSWWLLSRYSSFTFSDFDHGFVIDGLSKIDSRASFDDAYWIVLLGLWVVLLVMPLPSCQTRLLLGLGHDLVAVLVTNFYEMLYGSYESQFILSSFIFTWVWLEVHYVLWAFGLVFAKAKSVFTI